MLSSYYIDPDSCQLHPPGNAIGDNGRIHMRYYTSGITLSNAALHDNVRCRYL